MTRYIQHALQRQFVLPLTLGTMLLLSLTAFVLLQAPHSVTLAVLLVGLGTAGVAGLTALLCQRLILQPLQALFTTCDHVSLGNMQARTATTRHDELGALAKKIDRLFDQLVQRLETAEEERDILRAAFQQLRMEVSEVARGNLTVEARPTTATTEALTAAFNTMIRQLRTVITRVQDTVRQVSSSTHSMQLTTESLAQGSNSQTAHIAESSVALDAMHTSIHNVSAQATLSVTVAAQALAHAKQGVQAMQNTLQGIQRLQAQVHATALRSQQLGACSQEINEMVQLIGDLAERTSVLALNASIEAALAGEAGQGFAIVAQEVERLAQRATTTTRHIASLVATLQNETQAVVSAMEESTHEVVQGAHLADQAGQTLGEIETVSARLAELMHAIALAAGQQAQGSEHLLQAVDNIAHVTQRMAAGAQQATASLHTLATLTDELQHTVGLFTLPAATPTAQAAG